MKELSNLRGLPKNLALNQLIGALIRFAIGGKVGFLISARNKYKGDALTGDFQEFNKTVKIDNINFIRYGLTARIGYGIFNFYAFYSFSELFEHSASPSMFPISFGISLLKY